MEVETCCSIQTACDACSNVYKVNSITYCCPNCVGEVLVTALVCTCTIVVPDPTFAPNCTVSNKIVGDYIYQKPSEYTATGIQKSAGTWTLLVTGFLTVLAAQRVHV